MFTEMDAIIEKFNQAAGELLEKLKENENRTGTDKSREKFKEG